MKLNDVFARLERVAPVALSDEFCKKYGAYDNSGIIINCGKVINGALFALDLTKAAVREAKNRGFNLIVTHHPAIYGGVNRLDTATNPQAAAIAECLKSGISVISMHLNFDAAPEGIDYYLMRGLGGESAEISEPCQNGGYGRVYDVRPRKFSDYVAFVSKEFSTDKALFYGDKNREISRVASFCGAGSEDKSINFATEKSADVFVSSDMKHHHILALLERGVCVLTLTHYASENYGFNKIYLKIKDELGVPSAYFFDARM